MSSNQKLINLVEKINGASSINHCADESLRSRFDQETINSKHVAIVGSGTISNFVISYLCGLGIGKLSLFEPEINVVEGSSAQGANRFQTMSSEFLLNLGRYLNDELRRKKIKNYFSCKSQKLEVDKKFEDKVKVKFDVKSGIKSEVKTKLDLLNLMIKKINPKITVTTFEQGISFPFLDLLSPDVLIDVTNDPCSKYSCMSACETYFQKFGVRIPLISASSSTFKSVIGKFAEGVNLSGGASEMTAEFNTQFNLENILFEEFESCFQGDFTSGLIGTLVVDEIRKEICLLEADKKLCAPIIFDFMSGGFMHSFFQYDQMLSARSKNAKINFKLEEKFNKKVKSNPYKKKSKFFNKKVNLDLFKFYQNPDKFIRSFLSSKNILVVGLGGIGTYVALNSVLAGFGKNQGVIDLCDGDIIEQHNLNRQIFYFGKIGSNKSLVLSERLKQLSSTNSMGIWCAEEEVFGRADYIRAHPVFVDEAFLETQLIAGQYDLIFSCVDNWSSRKLMSDYAVEMKVPLINGSVGTYFCEADFFIPGKSLCLDCCNDYVDLVSSEVVSSEVNSLAGGEEVASCADLVANVVMPNAFVGSFMVGLGIKILLSDYFPESIFTAQIGSVLGNKFEYNCQKSDDHKFSLVADDILCSRYCECECHKLIV
ncbi:hypothetical protein HN587_04755 [Candidatus Woesearchaeota archaeon]|jgi:molybdopterin/thiamine biosynthesis adenylyltransferase|nr:hypothetical protein [Candidatus Woesearchaeota archaeon]